MAYTPAAPGAAYGGAPAGVFGVAGAPAVPPSLPENVTYHEWRTIQALDGAFKDMPTDPQIVDIEGSRVTRLPETYRGRRLGHNWSISWVADEIAQQAAPAQTN